VVYIDLCQLRIWLCLDENGKEMTFYKCMLNSGIDLFFNHTHVLVEALAWMHTLGSNIRRYQCYRNIYLCIHMKLTLCMSQKDL